MDNVDFSVTRERHLSTPVAMIKEFVVYLAVRPVLERMSLANMVFPLALMVKMT